ncbi:hypothetical protein OXX79_013561, partial [Metschnikowia pulcherrima]
MKPGFRALATAITYLLSVVSAVTITQNTVEVSTINLSLGDLTINSGVYYSIVNNALTALVGTVDNRGGFYVSSANGLAASVVMTGASFSNAGTLAFNSLTASVLSTYDIATIGAFSNTGNMYMGVSSATLVGTPFTVTSVSSWSNSGMMVFRRASGSAGSLVIEQVVGSGGLSSITNSGSICLYNVDWTQTTNIVGSGCITVGSGSELNLQIAVGSVAFSVSTTQTIYLSSSDSALNVVGLSTGLGSYPTYKVAGFGGGNTININLYFTSYSYSSSTGILTLSSLFLFGIDFNIGKGYKSSLFSTVSALTGRSITYSGSAPNSAPAVCSCVYSFPSVTTTPLASSTSTSASSTRSSSARSSTITSSSSSATKGSSSSSAQSPSVII